MKTKQLTRFVLTACMILTIFCSCEVKHNKVDYTAVETLIEQTAENYIEDFDMKGISVGFIDIDGYRYKEGFGNAMDSSFYSIASITKVITGLAIMQLIEQDKIDLDTPVNNYIPEFTLNYPYPDTPDITIRHLITHTSGLSRDNLADAQGYCPPEKNHLINYLKNHFQPLPAGYRHCYSNPGVELLGYIIERMSGRDYASYIDANILKPLEMTKSNFKNKIYAGMHNAGAYTMFSDSLYKEMPINYIAAGGLKSNVPEMLNLVELFLNKGIGNSDNIVNPESIQKMFYQQNSNILLDTDIQTGVLFFLEDIPDPLKGKLVYHAGGAIYNNSMLMMAPEYGIGVVVLCNTAGSYQQIDQLARSIINKALFLKTGKEPGAAEPVFPEKADWAKEDKQKITGNFYTASNIITIKENSNDIIAKVNDNKFSIIYYDDNFFTYYDGFYLKVKQAGDDRILFYYNGYNLTPIGKDKREIKAIPKNLIKSLGKYKLTEICPDGHTEYYETIRIDTLNNNLAAFMLPGKIVRDIYGITNEIRIILIPVNDTTAAMAGFGRYPGEAVYFDNKSGQIRFSGLTFQKK